MNESKIIILPESSAVSPLNRTVIVMPRFDRKTVEETVNSGALPISYRKSLEDTLKESTIKDYHSTKDQKTLVNMDQTVDSITWERVLNYQGEFKSTLERLGIIEEIKSIIIIPKPKFKIKEFDKIKFNLDQLNKHPHFGSISYHLDDQGQPFIKVFYGDNEEMFLNIKTSTDSILKSNGSFLVQFDLFSDNNGDFVIKNLFQNESYTSLSIDNDEKFQIFVVGLRNLAKSITQPNHQPDRHSDDIEFFKERLFVEANQILRANQRVQNTQNRRN